MATVEGLDRVLGNLHRYEAETIQKAADAAGEIAELLEAYAKTNAPFTDRTGNLRASIDGTWSQVRGDVFRVVLSAGMEYAQFVELLHNGKYSYLWPAMNANLDRIHDIWQRRLSV